MKKIFAILLAVTMLASMATVASAAENSKTTTLTTEVPAATYTLNIPADQAVAFGEESTDIGEIKVTNANGFAKGKNLNVTVSYTNFVSQSVDTEIPLVLYVSRATTSGQILTIEKVASGSYITFAGRDDGTVSEYAEVDDNNHTYDRNHTWVKVNSADWGKALAGTYTATITFTAEVVVEE